MEAVPLIESPGARESEVAIAAQRNSALVVAAGNFPMILTLVSPFLTLSEVMRLLFVLIKVVSVSPVLHSPHKSRTFEEASFAPIGMRFLQMLVVNSIPSKASSRDLRKVLRRISCRVLYRGHEEQSVTRAALKSLHALMSSIPLQFPRSFKKSQMNLAIKLGGLTFDVKVTLTHSKKTNDKKRIEFAVGDTPFSFKAPAVMCSKHNTVSLMRCHFCGPGVAACSSCEKVCHVCLKRACSDCHADFSSCFDCQRSFCDDCCGHSFQAEGNALLILFVCNNCAGPGSDEWDSDMGGADY